MKYLIGRKQIVAGIRIIIDEVLLWCSNVDALFIHFECICKIFRKYEVSFRLNKCNFLKARVEYVGHDVTNNDNYPASSKFDIINDWQLPERVESLFSFIGLLNFYHRYAPYMEIRLKPLRKLLYAYYRNSITLAAWTP